MHRLNPKKKQKSSLGLWQVALPVLGISILWFMTVAIVNRFYPIERWALFGDSFGALNTLFSGLAFAGVILTLFLQMKELQLQRDELAETRKEIAGQREQMEMQNETARQRLFEESFFQVLRRSSDALERIRATTEEAPIMPVAYSLADLQTQNPRESVRYTYSGDAAIRVWQKRLGVRYSKALGHGKLNEIMKGKMAEVEAELDHLEAVTIGLFKHAGTIATYFGTLEVALEMLEREGVDQDDTKARLVRTQVTEEQSVLLAYYLAFCPDKETSRYRAMKYGLLAQLEGSEFLVVPAHCQILLG